MFGAEDGPGEALSTSPCCLLGEASPAVFSDLLAAGKFRSTCPVPAWVCPWSAVLLPNFTSQVAALRDLTGQGVREACQHAGGCSPGSWSQRTGRGLRNSVFSQDKEGQKARAVRGVSCAWNPWGTEK